MNIRNIILVILLAIIIILLFIILKELKENFSDKNVFNTYGTITDEGIKNL